MGFRVRSPDGELRFDSLYDIERAYAHGLVDENDEMLKDGDSTWRKVGTVQVIRQGRPGGGPTPFWRTPMVLFGLGGAGLALILLFKGYWIAALVVALLASTAISGVTYRAFKKRP
ncbi:MAG TPA: hypothetical protein VK447_14325 [Myxococcaceae bacterium]|nr:hypothetical protein [Myxococcaceae bacterium]